MKKLMIIGFMIGLFILPSNVFAASMTTNISGPSLIDKEASFQVSIGVNSPEGVLGLLGSLNYDHSLLQLVSDEGQNGFNTMVGANLIADTVKPITSGNIAILNFKATTNFKEGSSTTISLLNVKGVVGSSALDVSSNSVSLTVSINMPKSGDNNLLNLSINGNAISGFSGGNTYYDLGKTTDSQIAISGLVSDYKATALGFGTKSLNYGNNVFTVNIIAENGSEKAYTIAIFKEDSRSSNNYLKTLSINCGKLDFDKLVNSYTVDVDLSVKEIEILGTLASSKANANGFGKFTINEGINTFKIIITAENNETREYVIIVNKKDTRSKNNYLKSLTTNIGKIKFDKFVNYYVINVNNDINDIEVKGISEDINAKVAGNRKYNLKVGSNMIEIIVTSENNEIRIYKLEVVKSDNRSSNNYLQNITVSEGHLSFNKFTYNYTVNVDNDIREIELNGFCEDIKARVLGNQKYSLSEGLNSFKLTITAENGEVRVYYINIVRKLKNGEVLSNNNNLKTLNINGVEIILTNENTYNISVSNTTTNLDIIALADDNKAIVTFNTFKLKVGLNKLLITVTAPNGEIKTYTLNITKKDSIPYLNLNDLNFTEDVYRVKVDELLSDEILNKLRNSNKTFYFEIYNKLSKKESVISLKGKYIPKTKEDFLKIMEFLPLYDLYKPKNAIYFKLNKNSNGSYTLYLDEQFSKDVFLYKIINNKLKLVLKKDVEDQMLILPNLDKGLYILTNQKKSLDINWAYIIIVVETLGLGSCAYVIYIINKTRPKAKAKKSAKITKK